MKPIKFIECNKEFARNQEEYNTLPAYHVNSVRGEVITCWKMTFKERLKVLFTGKIWLNLLSFNDPLTPSYMTTNKSELIK